MTAQITDGIATTIEHRVTSITTLGDLMSDEQRFRSRLATAFANLRAAELYIVRTLDGPFLAVVYVDRLDDMLAWADAVKVDFPNAALPPAALGVRWENPVEGDRLEVWFR